MKINVGGCPRLYSAHLYSCTYSTTSPNINIITVSPTQHLCLEITTFHYPYIHIILVMNINTKLRQKSANQKEKANQTLFDLAKKIEQERNDTQEVSKMLNAYCKVEEIKVPHQSSNHRNKTTSNQTNKNPSSSYANKVKETLKEMNINRSKQLGTYGNRKQIIDKNKKIDNIWKDSKKGAAEKHLMSRGVQKIYGVLLKKYTNISYLFFSVVAAEANQEA